MEAQAKSALLPQTVVNTKWGWAAEEAIDALPWWLITSHLHRNDWPPGKPKSEPIYTYYARLQITVQHLLTPINTLVCWERSRYLQEVELQLQIVTLAVQFSTATACLSCCLPWHGQRASSEGPMVAVQPPCFLPWWRCVLQEHQMQHKAQWKCLFLLRDIAPMELTPASKRAYQFYIGRIVG